MKKITALVTVLTLSLSLTAGATGMSATTSPDQIYQSGGAITTNAGYVGTVSLNGSVLNTSNVPPSPSNATVPLRLVAEADGGWADWHAEDGRSSFDFNGNKVDIYAKTGVIRVNSQPTGLTASFNQGTTFAPAAIFSHMNGYSSTNANGILTITTPNGSTLSTLANNIIKSIPMAATMKASASEMESHYGLAASNFDEVIGYFPMMVNADTVIIGKVKAGKMDVVKTQLEAIRAQTEKNFFQYLPEPEAMAKNGQIVTDGNYVMLIISSNNAKATELFKNAV